MKTNIINNKLKIAMMISIAVLTIFSSTTNKYNTSSNVLNKTNNSHLQNNIKSSNSSISPTTIWSTKEWKPNLGDYFTSGTIYVVFQVKDSGLIYVGGNGLINGKGGGALWSSPSGNGDSWTPVDETGGEFSGSSNDGTTPTVKSIYQTKDGTIYVGGNGLINGKGGGALWSSPSGKDEAWTPVDETGGEFSGSSNGGTTPTVKSIYQTKDGTIYVGGNGLINGKGGGALWSSPSGKDEAWTPVDETGGEFKYNNGTGGYSEVESIYQTKDGTIYVGGQYLRATGSAYEGEGWVLWSLKNNGQGEQWSPVDEDNREFDGGGGVNSFYQTKDGTIYVGGEHLPRGNRSCGLLSLKNGQGEQWSPVDETGGEFEEYINVNVYSIYQTKDGTIYVGGVWLKATGGAYKGEGWVLWSLKNGQGEQWSPVDEDNREFDGGGGVNSFYQTKDGTIYVGGQYLRATGGAYKGKGGALWRSDSQLSISYSIDKANTKCYTNKNNTQTILNGSFKLIINIDKSIYSLSINGSTPGTDPSGDYYFNTNNLSNDRSCPLIQLYNKNDTSKPIFSYDFSIRTLISANYSNHKWLSAPPNSDKKFTASDPVYFDNNKKISYKFGYLYTGMYESQPLYLYPRELYDEDKALNFDYSSSNEHGCYYAKLDKNSDINNLKDKIAIKYSSVPIELNNTNNYNAYGTLYIIHLEDYVGNYQNIIVQVGGNKINPLLTYAPIPSTNVIPINYPSNHQSKAVMIGEVIGGIVGTIAIISLSAWLYLKYKTKKPHLLKLH